MQGSILRSSNTGTLDLPLTWSGRGSSRCDHTYLFLCEIETQVMQVSAEAVRMRAEVLLFQWSSMPSSLSRRPAEEAPAIPNHQQFGTSRMFASGWRTFMNQTCSLLFQTQIGPSCRWKVRQPHANRLTSTSEFVQVSVSVCVCQCVCV